MEDRERGVRLVPGCDYLGLSLWRVLGREINARQRRMDSHHGH
jgi:hypothetical protein